MLEKANCIVHCVSQMMLYVFHRAAARHSARQKTTPRCEKWLRAPRIPQLPQCRRYLKELVPLESDHNLAFGAMIPMFDELKEILLEYKTLDYDSFVIRPDKTDFTDKFKSYRFDVRALMRKSLKAAGLEKVNRWGEDESVTPHTFRYTFCSFCLGEGYDLDTVRKWAGHTAEHYGYLQADMIDLMGIRNNGTPPPQPDPEEREKSKQKNIYKKVTSLMKRFRVIIDDDGKGKGKRK